jgi:hypothetical protein
MVGTTSGGSGSKTHSSGDHEVILNANSRIEDFDLQFS